MSRRRGSARRPQPDYAGEVVGDSRPLVEPALEHDAILGLPRLLEVARLTPAQVLVLAIDLLSGLQARGPAGVRPGEPFGYAVVVGSDGRARLTTHPGHPGHPGPNGHGPAEPAGAAPLLAELAAAADRSTRHPDQRAADQLAALDRAADAAAAPGASVAAVAEPLRAALPSDSGRQQRAELARLVRAANGLPAVAPAAVPEALPYAPREATPRSRPVARTVVSRAWKWGVSIVVLAGVILLEFTFLSDRISQDIGVVLDAGRAGSVTATARPTPPPVVPPAPQAAGAVAGVDLRALHPCTPGSDCQVRLQVLLHPRPEPQTVDWNVRVDNPCTGATVAGPQGTVAVPPDGDRAVVVDTVALPPGAALAVLAQISAPAVAASAPLLVPVEGACATTPPEPSR